MSFSLTAVFGMDSTGVRTEIRQLRREFNNFVNEFGKLGGSLAIGAFVALSKGALDLASNLKDLAAQLGIGVEKLQVMHYAAEQNGSSIDEMNKSLEKLRLNTQSAAEGNETYIGALTKLGLKTAQLIGQPLERKYELVAKAYANSTNKAEAYNAVSDLFGSKIGPKMIETLESLAKDGFKKTADAAAAAGHIMSAQTIVALEAADQAIQDFKKRATIAVGDILVNFRSEEGLKLILFQLLRAAGVFGAKIIDALGEVAIYIHSAINAAFISVTNIFRDELVTTIKDAAGLINKILPDKFKIDLGKIEEFRSAGKTFGEEFSDAVAKSSPLTTFAKDVGDFWDRQIAGQKKVVDGINKADLGGEAKKLTDAGKDFVKAAETASRTTAEELKDASDHLKQSGLSIGEAMANGAFTWKETTLLWNDTIDKWLNASRQVGALIAGIRGGSTFNDLSDEALAEVVRQNRAKAQALQYQAKTTGIQAGDNVGLNIEAARLQAEAINAQQQLDIRNRFRSDIASRGVEGARGNYDPVLFETMLRRFGPGADSLSAKQDETNRLLKDIKNGIPVIPRTATGSPTI